MARRRLNVATLAARLLRVVRLREQIQTGTYRVDPDAVAEAMLRSGRTHARRWRG